MNDGLTDAMVQGDVYPLDALNGAVGNIIDGLTDFSSGHVPGYIDSDFAAGDRVVVVAIDEKYSGVVIIADCPIQASNGLILEGVVIASTALGNRRALAGTPSVV